jgi:DNA-binding transcriptional regulator YiaG
MKSCAECGGIRLELTVKPEHLEDLGGIKVRLLNAVKVLRCLECGEEYTAIPDMQGLVRAVALTRSLIPIQLSGKEVRFIRRALDLTQQMFAEEMGLKSVETVSRWENDVPGTGGSTEKTLRHNICALLHKEASAIDYDPLVITKMKILPRDTGEELEPLTFERVRFKHPCCGKLDAWDVAA